MIVYFLVLTFWYGEVSPQPVIIPQTYQSKEACETAGIEALKDFKKRRTTAYADWNNFTCVPWNQEGD